jgi:deoxyribonuclease (pyrimidine dimer)
MTRVNLIPPDQLTNKHLVAEFKELSQLIGQVRKMIKNPNTLNKIPKEFTLNTGHVTFFVDKLLYIKNRHQLIKQEMLHRGFKADANLNLIDLPPQLFNDYIPTPDAVNIVRTRIQLRISEKPHLYPDKSTYGWR